MMMGKASTENQKAVDLLMAALNNPNSFTHLGLTEMLKSLVPCMTLHEVTMAIESIGLDLYDLEELK